MGIDARKRELLEARFFDRVNIYIYLYMFNKNI